MAPVKEVVADESLEESSGISSSIINSSPKAGKSCQVGGISISFVTRGLEGNPRVIALDRIFGVIPDLSFVFGIKALLFVSALFYAGAWLSARGMEEPSVAPDTVTAFATAGE
jgi:hypothetical protein